MIIAYASSLVFGEKTIANPDFTIASVTNGLFTTYMKDVYSIRND